MGILVNTHTEQEEKILLAFLNSLKFDYTAMPQDQEGEIQSDFLKRYNQEIDAGVAEIEHGNFVVQEDVEKFFADRRKNIK